MKHIYKLLTSLSVFVLLLSILSCTSDNEIEPLFDQSINERTEALKAEYLNILRSPKNGWIGYYSPNNSFGYYSVLLDFDSNGNVSIKSDYDTGSTNNNITYRIDKTLKVELVFESSSVFSQIFAINNNNNAGEFVFNILSATVNEIVLESKLDFGDDVTIFNLRRARPEELDLSPVYASVDNIYGDETSSVYRNILFKDDAIGLFGFNPVTRFATVSYAVGEIIETVNVPIIITDRGFTFVEPVEIDGVTLYSFEYDEAENLFKNPADALVIKYEDTPPIFFTDAIEQIGTTGHQNFGYDLEDGVNPLTSPNFNNLISEVNQNIKDLGDVGANLSFIEFEYYAEPDDDGNVQIWIGILDGSDGLNFWAGYSFAQNIQDNKVYLSFNEALNENAIFFNDVLDPLLQFFNSSEGLYYTNNGPFVTNAVRYVNQASTFTSAQDPSLRVYGLWLN